MDLMELERLFISVVDEEPEGDEFFQTRSRDGIFGSALTMWLMMCRRLQGGQSIGSIVEYLSAGGAEGIVSRNRRSERFKGGEISTNSGGLSRAQERLKIDKVRSVTRRLTELLIREKGEQLRWHGKQVFLMDGTKISLSRSGELLSQYDVSRNQSGKSYTPLMQCLFCHELFSGVALEPSYGSFRGAESVCETSLSYELISRLPKESLLIGDRGFGIFPVAYQAEKQGVEVLLRLTRTRASYIAGKEAVERDFCDLQVNWKLRTTRVKELNIPPDAVVPGRIIKATIHRNGFRPLELLFFTTSKAPAAELVALYEQRERIENDIRSLKYTLGMERLWSKSAGMLEKELLLGVAAYNLVRIVLAQAAEELQIQPRDISFSRGANLIRIYGNKMRDASSDEERQTIRKRLIKALSQVKHPKRRNRRTEPRKVTQRNDRFGLMRLSREEEREKAARTLSEYGHRGYFTTVSRKY